MLRSTTSALILLAAATVDARPVTAPATTAKANAAMAATATAQPITVAVHPGDGVSFARAVFVDANGDPHDLPEAIATIDPTALTEATGLRRGYLQIVTEMGPVAYDVPIRLDDSETWPRALRGLRIRHGDAESALEIRMALADDADQFQLAQVAFTAEPLFDMQGLNAAMGSVPLTTFPLAVQYESVGGNGPNGQFAPPPVGPSPLPPMIIDGGDLADLQYTQPKSWNVETARMQCVPAAFANVFAYLDGTYGQLGVAFPQSHIPGIGNDNDPDSLVSQMDMLAGRPHQDTCRGDGTFRCSDVSSGMRGALEFLNQYDSDVVVDLNHQGGQSVYPDGCGGLDQPLDRESFRQGGRVSWDWVCDRVQDGAGIYMEFGYYSMQAQGEGGGVAVLDWGRTGGHAVRVFGCSQVGAQRFLHTLDDGQQNRMNGRTCVERDGLRHTIVPVLEDETTNGRLVLGVPGRQIEFAMAFTPAGL